MLIALLALHWWDVKNSDSVLAEVIDSFLSSIKQSFGCVKHSIQSSADYMHSFGEKKAQNFEGKWFKHWETASFFVTRLNKLLKSKASEW